MSETPVKPKAAFTSASVSELSFMRVDVGDTTVAPLGALSVTLLKLVLEEVSTAEMERPAGCNDRAIGSDHKIACCSVRIN